MKHTDFYSEMFALKNKALQELKAAVRAHGGRFDFFDENGDQVAEPPIVLVNSDSGPSDHLITSLYFLDGFKDVLVIEGEQQDEYIEYDIREIDIDDIVPYHFDFIIDAIPETDDVKDVSEPCDEFPITYLSRADLEEKYDVANITDDQMRQLAKRMGSAYCENGFWIDLDIIADYLELPKKTSDGI